MYRLLWTGTNYHNSLKNSTLNPFWNSVRESFAKWYKILDQNEYIDVAHQPLWGNTQMNIPINHKLLKHNISLIGDLFDVNGNPRTKDSLETAIGSNLMFTAYHALWRSMPNNWKEIMRGETRHPNLTLPPVLQWLLKDKKGTRNIRAIWALKNNESVPVGQEKWSLEFNNPNTIDWSKIYMLPKICKLNARITYFQYQINHRSLVTNKKLQQFGIRDNNLCDRCGEIETISHLLFECHFAQDIWTEVYMWLNNTINSELYMDKMSILLGDTRNEIITTCIISIVKHELYKCKWNKNALSIHRLKHIIKGHMELDCYLGTIQSKKNKTLGKWSSVFNELQNL